MRRLLRQIIEVDGETDNQRSVHLSHRARRNFPKLANEASTIDRSNVIERDNRVRIESSTAGGDKNLKRIRLLQGGSDRTDNGDG